MGNLDRYGCVWMLWMLNMLQIRKCHVKLFLDIRRAALAVSLSPWKF